MSFALRPRWKESRLEKPRKNVFEPRRESNLMAFFSVFGLSSFWYNDESPKLLNRNLIYKCTKFGWDLGKKIEPVVTDKHAFKCRNTSKLLACSWFFGLSRFRCICLDAFSLESISSSVMRSIERSMEELKPVVMKKVEFEIGI